jgi:hypothetical protein
VGKSYRFLAGIAGVEDSDWEETYSQNDHNGYSGSTDASADDTISYFCSQCHGKFHRHIALGTESEVGESSAWLRHPTDVALAPSNGSPFENGLTTYSIETPVAFPTPSTSVSAVDGDSIVTCLSCHRAHASPNADILRFAYSDGAIFAGDGDNDGGCENCHLRQR